MERTCSLGLPLSYLSLGVPAGDEVTQLVWGHGWQHEHQALLPMARYFATTRSNLLVDFPGFGLTPPPPAAWDSRNYADHVAEWLRSVPKKKRVWIGHSFGCRVGIQLAAFHPELVDGLALIAAAGLPRRRSPMDRAKNLGRRYAYKTLKRLLPFPGAREWLRRQFGSRDYLEAGALRSTLVRIVQEDLSASARMVKCPVTLIYGEEDTETPVSMGEDFQKLFPDATLVRLPKLGHLDVLTTGQHQITHQISMLVDRIS